MKRPRKHIKLITLDSLIISLEDYIGTKPYTSSKRINRVSLKNSEKVHNIISISIPNTKAK